jgi:hypothetical protein
MVEGTWLLVCLVLTAPLPLSHLRLCLLFAGLLLRREILRKRLVLVQCVRIADHLLDLRLAVVNSIGRLRWQLCARNSRQRDCQGNGEYWGRCGPSFTYKARRVT